MAVGSDEAQSGRARSGASGQEERAELRVDEWRDLHHDHAADLVDVALRLEKPTDAGEVRVQPVLLGVLLRRLAERDDHLVDVVLQLGDLALNLDRNALRKVAARHDDGHVRDRAQLRSEGGRELVDVLSEVSPRSGYAGDLRLAAELALRA